MSFNQLLPVLIVASSALCGVTILFLGNEQVRVRTAVNLTGAIVKLSLVIILLLGVSNGENYVFSFTLAPGLEFVLRADPLSLLFATLSSVLWLITTIYAVGYLEKGVGRSRFFAFFSFCVSATVGVSLSGNLFTFVVFYELLTLVTWPLVVHRGTSEAAAAGRTYLRYTLAGGLAVLAGVVLIHLNIGSTAFVEGGITQLRTLSQPLLVTIAVLLIGGFGVKAALFPLHGWLPRSMVAPAPVSALLHAVAVVKAGAFGIVRTIYEVFGIEFAHEIGLLDPLALIAGFTIIYGSVRAFQQVDLKRRLAWSTVSQVSYIALGIATFGPLATIGGLVHLVHQGLMKITLFFCAGNMAERLGVHRVDQFAGLGKRMPWTMAAFSLGALGMIGVPPLAGFVSKWYLALGAVAADKPFVLLVISLSTVINAMYFLPLLHAAWFRAPTGDATSVREFSRLHWMLTVPALVTAALALFAGLLAGSAYSPLDWVRLISAREYAS